MEAGSLDPTESGLGCFRASHTSAAWCRCGVGMSRYGGFQELSRSPEFPRRTYQFVDLFAGCGGLSLGMSMAGMQGRFAVERDAMAFDTFQTNLVGQVETQISQFDWPEWLAKRAWDIDELLTAHKAELVALRGSIDVLTGGPPCQGFSFAGRRQENDPRNQLFTKYVEVVEAIRPRAIVLENVPGMRVAHVKGFLGEDTDGGARESFYQKLLTSLDRAGYAVEGRLVDAADFGVPQRRKRLIAIGIRKEEALFLEGGAGRILTLLEGARKLQLAALKLAEKVSAADAISDLETVGKPLKDCTDSESQAGFLELNYDGPITPYQKLMRAPWPPPAMNSMRLARHKPEVSARFARIITECVKGVRMNEESRAKYGLKKQRIFPMAKGDPAPTITTLPDDVLHYSEPRILSVRESARLQSFPDWFEFRGRFTTGGYRRTKECPRYTQVGNAVPPYLGRAIGIAVRAMLDEVTIARAASEERSRSAERAPTRRLALVG